MSRITDAETDDASEGKYFIKLHLMASATPLAISACKTTKTPPPDMFLMQPNVYLLQAL